MDRTVNAHSNSSKVHAEVGESIPRGFSLPEFQTALEIAKYSATFLHSNRLCYALDFGHFAETESAREFRHPRVNFAGETEFNSFKLCRGSFRIHGYVKLVLFCVFAR